MKQPTDDVVLRRKLKTITTAVAELKRLTPSDAFLADAVGYMRAAEIEIAKQRHRYESLTAEMEPMKTWHPDRRVQEERAGAPLVEGKDYSLVPTFKHSYTYNTPAILWEITQHIEGGPTDALMDAIGADAVRLTWQLTNLRKYLEGIGATIRQAPEAVDDHSGLDAAMIGKVTTPGAPKRVALKRD